MTLKSKDVKALKKELDMVRFYRNNPIIAAEDLLRVKLAVPQQLVLADMWFKNFCLITAGRGTGKCVAAGTLVPSSKGLVRIEDLGSDLYPLSDLDIYVQGKDGKNRTSKWYYDGVQPVNKITTSFGYSIAVTDDHPLLILNSDGEFEWKRSEEFKVGDYVPIQRHYSVGSSEDLLSSEQALLCGLLVGDGCFRGNKYHLSFTSGDKSNRDLYSRIFEDQFGFSPRLVDDGKRCPSLISSRKCVWNVLEEWGLENGIKSENKTIPKSVLFSSRRVLSNFLKGLFESDGGCEKNSVSYCTKSPSLAYEVHQSLLYLGIISKLKPKKVMYREKEITYYTVSITGAAIEIFNERIGFLSERKNNSLASLCDKSRNTNVDIIPGLSSVWNRMWDKTRDTLNHREREKLKRLKYGKELPSYSTLSKQIDLYPFDDSFKGSLSKIFEKEYFFDKVISVDKSVGKVYDLVVPGDNSFSAGGFVNHNTYLNSVFACLWAMLYPGQKIGLLAPSFRQAKMLFSEVESRWNQAPLLQEATKSKPTIASDRCYLHFRQAGFRQGSTIEAVPLGDGQKIRGARYYVIIADEFAQIPVEIFNTVILPMGATVADPMANVARIARERALINSGKARREDFLARQDNKVVMTSSAFYQFNHMYQTKQKYEEAISKGETKYATHTISFRDMPEGFLSEDNIKNSKARLSNLEFRMEYEAIWEADSSGIFKASLIEKCKRLADHSIALKGSSGSDYILGVDPARASDAFALCLIEIGNPCKVVAAWEYYQNVFPVMAKTIMDVCDLYNVVAIHMDAGAGGGGLALKDLLEEEDRWGSASKRILDVGDEQKIGLAGRRILHMFNPSPKSIADSVYSSLNLMEKGSLVFPRRPQPTGDTSEAFDSLADREQIYDVVEDMLRQLMLIEATQSRSGIAHFDVPSGGGHSTQKKDLFTAFYLAARKAYELSISEEEESKILEIGIVANRVTGPIFSRPSLSNSIELSQAPINSWALRKPFKLD